MIIDSLKSLAVPIDSLQGLPGNPRQGDVDAVARSLKSFGQRKPIVVRKDDGTIIAGNHTWQAAKKLGWTEIAVAFVGDDDVTAKAYALADNRTAELGSYDEQALLNLIEEVHAVMPEYVRDAGWSEEAVADLVNKLALEQPKELNEDVIPEPPNQPKTKLGDVYKLGNHRLVCGDSTQSKILNQALEGKLADCIFTDPPYNVNYQGGTKEKLTIENDSMTTLDFENFLSAAYKAMFENIKNGGAIYVCHADGSSVSFRAKFIESGFMLKQILIWVKDNFTLSRQDYNWQHEPIIYGWKPGAAHSWYGPFSDSTVQELVEKDITKMSKDTLVDILQKISTTTTIIKEARPRKNSEHPTMKPVELIMRLVSNSAKLGDTILDPFGGSGSTLISAEKLQMRASIVELDPKYCDVIIKRWENLTGEKAVLVQNAESA